MLSIIREGLPKNPRKWTQMCQRCMGVSEETTTGVKRLYEMQAQGEEEGILTPHQASTVWHPPNHVCLVLRCSSVTRAAALHLWHEALCDMQAQGLLWVLSLLDAASRGALPCNLHCGECVDTTEPHDCRPMKQATVPVCTCQPCLWGMLGWPIPLYL